MYVSGKSAQAIVDARGLLQVTDHGAIEAVIDEVLRENPAEAESFRAGKEKVFGFLVGQVMRKSKGKANPQLVNELLRSKLR
jgi:aspartyl-tRNA(Asn)/glutamyl-tRNA(Gln) amidotransferase subunit B